jgi:hypothetical protein
MNTTRKHLTTACFKSGNDGKTTISTVGYDVLVYTPPAQQSNYQIVGRAYPSIVNNHGNLTSESTGC